MARDYVKSAYKRRVPEKKNGRMGVFVFLFILMVVSSGGAWVYFHKLHPSDSASIQPAKLFAQLKDFLHRKHMVKATVDQEKSDQSKPAVAKEVHFDFYDDLPNMQMNVAATDDAKVEPVKPPPLKKEKPKAVAATSSKTEEAGYVVRLGTFDDESAADQMRVSLLLSGVDAEIVKIDSGYALEKGSFDTVAEAKAIQKELLKKGIDGSIQKV